VTEQCQTGGGYWEPPVPVPVGGLSPGLVWVEGKGYLRPSVARAYAGAGVRVDWHRWSPGSGDNPNGVLYVD
jgi:hypothetical protein